jgi:sodium/bile acid cotransporter 7
MGDAPRRVAWPKPDMFTLMLISTVALASVLPAQGGFVPVVDVVGRASIILLFFLHGAVLSTDAVKDALGQWKVQLLILVSTFALFPVIGLLLGPLSGRAIDSSLYTGLLFLCCLPSTVQSSIALTSIARGNVPAAICAASASNLFGIVLTPLLTGLLLASQSAISFDAVWSIVSTILLPFAAGQLLHKRIGGWLKARKPLFSVVDRGSVLIMVYAAFGKAVMNGIWQTVSAIDLLILILFCLGLLAIVVATLRGASRIAKLSQPDEAALVFCGSVKSLVTGVPMASVLFPAAMVGAIVLPLMIYHQIQLIACAFLARAYGRSTGNA